MSGRGRGVSNKPAWMTQAARGVNNYPCPDPSRGNPLPPRGGPSPHSVGPTRAGFPPPPHSGGPPHPHLPHSGGPSRGGLSPPQSGGPPPISQTPDSRGPARGGFPPPQNGAPIRGGPPPIPPTPDSGGPTPGVFPLPQNGGPIRGVPPPIPPTHDIGGPNLGVFPPPQNGGGPNRDGSRHYNGGGGNFRDFYQRGGPPQRVHLSNGGLGNVRESYESGDPPRGRGGYGNVNMQSTTDANLGKRKRPDVRPGSFFEEDSASGKLKHVPSTFEEDPITGTFKEATMPNFKPSEDAKLKAPPPEDPIAYKMSKEIAEWDGKRFQWGSATKQLIMALVGSYDLIYRYTRYNPAHLIGMTQEVQTSIRGSVELTHVLEGFMIGKIEYEATNCSLPHFDTNCTFWQEFWDFEYEDDKAKKITYDFDWKRMINRPSVDIRVMKTPVELPWLDKIGNKKPADGRPTLSILRSDIVLHIDYTVGDCGDQLNTFLVARKRKESWPGT